MQKLVIPFIEAADADAKIKNDGHQDPRASDHETTLVSSYSTTELAKLMHLQVPDHGQGSDGLLQAIDVTLRYSVNTWKAGFMDKLYASTDAPGLAAELVLATLNTNVHVYAVSPALTIIEKHVTKALAAKFGLDEENSGGISVQGGAASNLTALLIARNFRYPEIKAKGMGILKKPLAIFTSSEAHYSVSTAASSLGFGQEAVCSVPVDRHGRMDIFELGKAIQKAKEAGKEPFCVSATAGTTVRGAYDPLIEIGEVCKKYKLWFHVDGAWGGPAIFSGKHKHKLDGSHLADTIACNPHKMMGVPMTCSFLLGKDMRKFYVANSLTAGYLFHDDSESVTTGPNTSQRLPVAADVYDLASFTPQCGRRGDSLKLYLAWIYHGTLGYEEQINLAFDACQYMASQVSGDDAFHLVSDDPPPCCQCCFYYRPRNLLETVPQDIRSRIIAQTRITRRIASGLVKRGWMIDYAPGELGEFLRVVTNRGTTHMVVDGLLKAIKEVGARVITEPLRANDSGSVES